MIYGPCRTYKGLSEQIEAKMDGSTTTSKERHDMTKALSNGFEAARIRMERLTHVGDCPACARWREALARREYGVTR